VQHPSCFMEELSDLKIIKDFNDLLRVNNFVYCLIPWTIVPFIEKLSALDLNYVYQKIKVKDIGGWCGINAEVLRLILKGYGIPCRPYNFGLEIYQFTHVGLLVQICDKEYFIDPYFSKHYVDTQGNRLDINSLLKFIEKQEFEKFIPIYGPGKKEVQTNSGWVYMTPQELETSVRDSFFLLNYEKIMLRYFNSTRFENLMLVEYESLMARILRNIGKINE